MESIYEKFNLGERGNIRLLELQPGRENDLIRCGLRCERLGTNPSYTCLSYMWEPKLLPGKVTIICENVSIEVTSNLHAALKALRHSKKTRALWVDAVCINQGDGHEKSTQIPLMKQIYRKAERVILRLGPSDPMTRSAFEKFKLLAVLWSWRAAKGAKEECSEKEFRRFMIHDSSELDDKTIFDLRDKCTWTSGPSAMQRGAMEYCDLSPTNDLHGSKAFEFGRFQLWRAIDDMFANPFFSRAWIIQEVSVARIAHVQCGPFLLPWELFRSAFNARQLLRCQPLQHSDPLATPNAVSTVRDARKRFWNDGFCTDLAGAMPLFSFSKAKDPRDYIYAALGLIKHTSRPGRFNRIVPDYTKDVSEVYLEAASHMIIERKDLYIWGLNDPPRTKTVTNLPTWVPDWSMESEEGNPYHCKLLFSRAFPGDLVIDRRHLRVNAHLLDTVCLVVDIVEVYDLRDLLAKTILLFREFGLGLFEPYQAESLNMKFSATVDGDGGSTSHKHPSPYLQRLGHAFSVLTKLKHVPNLVLKVLSDLLLARDRPNEDRTLAIEALWACLCNGDKDRKTGFQLFLAHLYFEVLTSIPGIQTLDKGISNKAYKTWLMAACILSAQQPQDTFWSTLCHEKLSQIMPDEERVMSPEALFITRAGYFGRCPKDVAKIGHHVAILGGAFRPYLLEKQPEGFYHFVSYAYVEGIMNMTALGPNMTLTRIEIR